MTPEEILKAAQANKSAEGEAEKEALRKSIIFGSLAGIFVCVITFIVKAIKGKIDFVEFVIILLFQGIINLYYGKKCNAMKKTIIGIVETVLGGVFFILFLGVMFS